jgi:hypothetical protein
MVKLVDTRDLKSSVDVLLSRRCAV